MRCTILALLLLINVPCVFANTLDEQEIKTENKSCSIHYLSTKSKNLWSIEVDKNYCRDGWVHGFTSVILKDALNRPAQTLSGYFHKGYWLSDFPGEISHFKRLTLQENFQDFIFPVFSNKELDLTYYLIARSTLKDNVYSPFEICPNDPLLLVTHQPTSDFRQSLFQFDLLKESKQYISQKCPNAKTYSIMGTQTLEENTPIVFRANVDIATDQVTLNYPTIADKINIPRPTELRHEQAESLLTIQPTNSLQTKILNPEATTFYNSITSPSQSAKNIQSAVDIALLVQVLQTPIQAKTIVYVSAPQKDYSFTVTHPLPLTIQTSETLSAGWYIINGIFHPHENEVIIQLLSAQQCKKEWCSDEI